MTCPVNQYQSHALYVMRTRYLSSQEKTMNSKVLLSTTLSALLLLSANVSHAQHHGNNVEQHLDNKGNRIEQRLDDKGDRIETRYDNKADRARDHGKDHLADKLAAKGDRIDQRLDNKGERINNKLDHKAERIDHRHSRHGNNH